MLIAGKLFKHLVFRKDGKPDAFFVYYDDEIGSEYRLKAEEVFLCMSCREVQGVIISKVLTSTGVIGDLYYATSFDSKFVLTEQE